MATVQYESRENAGRKFWTARYGRYAIRIDASRPGVFKWLITLEGRSVRKGVVPDRSQAVAAVSDALDEPSQAAISTQARQGSSLFAQIGLTTHYRH
jgi:hypothetical protein